VKRGFTRDEATQAGARDFSAARSNVLTVEQLGAKQSLTPEGFLLCEEVIIARTGMQIYGPGETPIEPGPDGVVRVMREPEDVFNPAFMASLEGKPMTDEHPFGNWQDLWPVNPGNWRDYTVGTCFNVRRGEGASDGFLIADLLVCHADTIEAVRQGKREISVGYKVTYEQTGEGEGRQTDMLGNHVALVKAGRCGEVCAIGDSQFQGDSAMGMPCKKTMLDSLLAKLGLAYNARDEKLISATRAEIAAIALDADGEEIPNAEEKKAMAAKDAATEERITKLEKGMDSLAASMKSVSDSMTEIASKIGAKDAEAAKEEEAAKKKEAEDTEAVEEEGGKEAAAAKDSAPLADTFQQVVAQAEILVPGIRLPAFDSKAKPINTVGQMCALRRQALDLAYVQPATRAMIDQVLGGKALNTAAMKCGSVRDVFNAAVALKRADNSGSSSGGGALSYTAPAGASRQPTIAEINERNRKRWEKK
jgi:hypothetical protein